MQQETPLSKTAYLSSQYRNELDFINKVILFQEYYYQHNGEIVLLIDEDFPGFQVLSDQKIQDMIYLYEHSGWKIRLESLTNRKECLLIFS